MKKSLFLLLTSIVITTSSLPVFAKENSTYELKNLKGPVWDNVSEYSEGLLAVSQLKSDATSLDTTSETGFVDLDGNYQVNFKNNNIQFDGYNINDTFLMDFQDFHNGLSLVNMMYNISPTDPANSHIEYLVMDKYFIDKEGILFNVVENFIQEENVRPNIISNFSNGVSAIYLYKDRSGSSIVFDKNGSIISNKKIENEVYIGPIFSEGLIAFGVSPSWDSNNKPINVKYGFMDKNKNIIIPANYNKVSNFSDGLAAVELNNQIGFINKQGKFIYQPNFDGVKILNELKDSAFVNGIAVVNKDGLWGAIDNKGNTIIDFEWSSLSAPHDDLIIAEKNKKFGYIDLKGNTIISPKYDSATFFYEGVALVKDGKNVKMIDKNENKVLTKEWAYEEVKNSYNQPEMILYKKGSRWGLAKIETKSIVPDEKNNSKITD